VNHTDPSTQASHIMEQVIHVVGIGPGIGAAVARRFAREGYAVGAVARSPESVRQQVDALRQAGARAHGATADAADPAGLVVALRSLHDALGDAGVRVYNAAAVTPAGASTLTAAQLDADLRVSAGAALTATQTVLPAMRARGAGTLLYTGGGFALEPAPALASLGAGKAALRNLVFSLYAEPQSAGLHAATVTVCGSVRAATPFDPDRIAEAYWQLHQQPDGARQREIQLRG
jgi:short-subunit dehydrogenase